MVAKLSCFLSLLVTVAYCQHDHHHTISLQSVVKHEVPKKVEHYHTAHIAKPTVHHVIQAAHPVPVQHIQHAQSHHYEAPKRYFIPVHEPAPVHETIAVVATPIHHIPVIHVPVHQTPVHHATVQHHAGQQASHHEHHHEESHHDDHDEHHIDYYAHPKYEYEYKVEDPHTGDKKYQHETRDGDVVHGVYSLHEPDGSIRTVKYSSDKKSGFNADIVHKGASKHEYHYHH